MSKLFLKIDTERTRTTKTVAANKEVRIRVFYGSADNSIKAYDLVITERNGMFPILDIEDSSSLLGNIKLNGKYVLTAER